MEEIGKKMAELAKRGKPIFLLGDWNQPKKTLDKCLAKWMNGAERVPVRGDEETWNGGFVPGRKFTAIDHVVRIGDGSSGSAKVNRNYSESDHWPMRVRVRLKGPAERELPRMSRLAVRSAAMRIVSGPTWDSEAESAKELREKCFETAMKSQCRSSPGRKETGADEEDEKAVAGEEGSQQENLQREGRKRRAQDAVEEADERRPSGVPEGPAHPLGEVESGDS
ncbi:MAG: uncharacterized protein A8A55_1715 [Amphiamblys sp. WSBS2006]|nr:MAG: uncharacterized protein A8A55_1715 [Amphiamblys sp. WSBS2006]